MSGRKITMNEWDMSDVSNNWNIVFRFDFELKFAFVISKKFELHNDLQMWKFKSWVLNLIIKIEIEIEIFYRIMSITWYLCHFIK